MMFKILDSILILLFQKDNYCINKIAIIKIEFKFKFIQIVIIINY